MKVDALHGLERLLAVFAHPDDESFGCAGTFAALTERGGTTTLDCATRGEAGEIGTASLATPEDLGKVRPQAVITFGADGMYGHPDHLLAHRTATAAVVNQPADRWRPTWLYHYSVPRERMQDLARQAGGAFADMTDEMLASFGTPRAEITTEIDVTPYLDRKWAAIMAHETQMGEGGPLSHLPHDVVLDMIRIEHYTLVPLPWANPNGDPLARLTSRAGAG